VERPDVIALDHIDLIKRNANYYFGFNELRNNQERLTFFNVGEWIKEKNIDQSARDQSEFQIIVNRVKNAFSADELEADKAAF